MEAQLTAVTETQGARPERDVTGSEALADDSERRTIASSLVTAARFQRVSESLAGGSALAFRRPEPGDAHLANAPGTFRSVAGNKKADAVRGLLIGSGLGALVGGLLGAVAYDDCGVLDGSRTCTPGNGTRGESIVAGVMAGGLFGGLVGIIIAVSVKKPTVLVGPAPRRL